MWTTCGSPYIRARAVFRSTTTTMTEPLFQDDTGSREDKRTIGRQAAGGDSWNPIGYFVDVCRAFGGVDPPTKVRARVGTEIKKLQSEGITIAHLKLGIQILVDRGLDPSRLPECVFTAQQKPDTLVGPDRERASEDAQLIRDLLDRNDGRWPTGARFVRGFSAGHTVFDPLGYDPRPRDFPHPKPSRDDVIRALRS